MASRVRVRIPFIVKFPSMVSSSRALISSASCFSSSALRSGVSLGSGDGAVRRLRKLDQRRRIDILDDARERAVAGLGTLEDAGEGVIVALADRVELVVVAARASDRQAEKRLARDVDLLVGQVEHELLAVLGVVGLAAESPGSRSRSSARRGCGRRHEETDRRRSGRGRTASNGLSALNEAITQSRYRQAFGYIMLALPLDSANLATSSQCLPQRSPKRGEASRPSTTFLKASSDVSVTNASTSFRGWRQPDQVEAHAAGSAYADRRRRRGRAPWPRERRASSGRCRSWASSVFLTAGGLTGLGGWNDQNWLPFEVSTFVAAAAFGSRGSGAPILTHASKSAIDLFRQGLSGGIWSESSVYRIAVISRLSSGLPGTTAGPVSPPLRRPSRLSTSRPPLIFVALFEWHFAHVVISTGRILVSKNFSCSGVIGRSTDADGAGFGFAPAASRAAAFFLARAPFMNGPAVFFANGPRPAAAPARSSFKRRNSCKVSDPSRSESSRRNSPSWISAGEGFLGGVLEPGPVREQLAELIERELAVDIRVAESKTPARGRAAAAAGRSPRPGQARAKGRPKQRPGRQGA